jgi:hypothetical protein
MLDASGAGWLRCVVKRQNRMTPRILTILLICCWGTGLAGSPASDLSSPSQEMRDAAAKILRQNYTAPSRTNWESVVSSITNGMTETSVLEFLSPFKVTPEIGFGSGGTHTRYYRLDDAWVLTCWFRNQGDVLFERMLSLDLRYVSVAPPTNFTGTWVTYFVNGQKSHEIHYDNGKRHGEFIAYYPEGSKCYIEHFNHHILEGEDTGYYPSGRINYRGVHKAGKQAGTWIWYNEDGLTNSTKDYSK